MPSQNNVTIADMVAKQAAQTVCNCGINSNIFTTPITTTTTTTTPTTTTTNTVGTSYN